jgi:hypothetical protein
MSYREIRAAFRDVADKRGIVSLEHVRTVLSRYTIDLAPVQFEELVEGTGASEEDGVNFAAVLAYFQRQQDDDL